MARPEPANADRPTIPEIQVFGFKLNPMVRQEFVDCVAWHVAHRERALMAHLNLHGMATMYDSPKMTSLMRRRETLVTIDGTPVTWLARLTGHRLNARHRVTSLDYIDELFRRAVANGWSVFYVGGTPEVLEKGLAHFRQAYPGLKLDGRHGYFDVNDWSADGYQMELVGEINAGKVDLLIVGMGMPRQEEWVESVSGRIEVPVVITIGAMLEYFAGSLPMPPRWLGPYGMEWVFRLATAPRRLAFRYFVEPFLLAGRIVRGRPRTLEERD